MSGRDEIQVISSDREVTIKRGDLEFVVAAPIALDTVEAWNFGPDAVCVQRIDRDAAGELEGVSEVSDLEAVRALNCSPKIVVAAKSRVGREISEKGLVVA